MQILVENINMEITEIQHMGRVHMDFDIVKMNQNLKQTVNFVYLGGNLSSKEGTISSRGEQELQGMHSRH